jgi:hypothetical protein
MGGSCNIASTAGIVALILTLSLLVTGFPPNPFEKGLEERAAPSA